MNSDEKRRLDAKGWQLNARTIRSRTSGSLAAALSTPPLQLHFANMSETRNAAALFSISVGTFDDIEFPNRRLAVEFVRRQFADVVGPSFLLQHDYENCGALKLYFEQAVSTVDPILRTQNDCFPVLP